MSMHRRAFLGAAATAGAAAVTPATLRAALPVSVQLLLPRFAVENDRLTATALVHNATDRPRTCRVVWQVDGASVNVADDDATWRRRIVAAKAVYEGEVSVAANSTARASLWLTFDQLADARISCHAADRDQPLDGDGEQRTISVTPLGRPVEYAYNGAFRRAQRIELPADFMARDLRISIARDDVPGALDGLGYLVGYPHGCVEQTMSRFLPAVMVKHALQQATIDLPPDVAATLPDVLQKGLARLYNFQHEDGSWGWFNRDARDDAMTVYVAYGLARCASTGTPVDRTVLQRACAYLNGRLQGGQLNEELAARAWYVLALAGEADAKQLDSFARRVLSDPKNREQASLCNVALACRVVGRNETAGRLWSRLADWRATSTPQLALKLTAQAAFGDAIDACYETAGQLLAQRQGHRWSHTRDTSWAIEALAELVRYAPPRRDMAKLTVTVAGKTVLDTRDAPRNAGAAAVSRLHLVGDRLPADSGVTIELTSADDAPMHYAVSVAGVLRLDEVKPVGDDVTITRRYTTLAGDAIDGEVNVGDVIAATVTVQVNEAQSYVMVEDARPAGFEFADDMLRGTAADRAAHVEFRDDRLCAFFARLPAGRHELVYYLRAETAGVSHVLPGTAYPMYDEKRRGETAADVLHVSQLKP